MSDDVKAAPLVPEEGSPMLLKQRVAVALRICSALYRTTVRAFRAVAAKSSSLGLAAQPDRRDLLTRLRHVLVSQRKAVNADIEARFTGSAVMEERAQDHQRAAV